MLRDIQLGYIPVKIIKVDSEMAEGLRVTFKKNNNIFEWWGFISWRNTDVQKITEDRYAATEVYSQQMGNICW